MSRILTFLIGVLIAILAFLSIRYAKDNYKPAETSTETQFKEVHDEPNFHTWREFAAPSGHFKVLLPSLPQHVTDKILDPEAKETRKYDTYVSADDSGSAFMVSSITFPKPIDETMVEQTLKSVVNDMLTRNKDNKLKTMKVGNFRNFRALDFSFSSTELTVGGKVFAHKDRLYVLSMINKDTALNQKELEFFINSFEITDDQAPVPEVAPQKKMTK